MSRKPQRSGLFHGFWYTLHGLKIERVKRSEYGEAYRLYALGTRYGLTDRGVGGAAAIPGQRRPSGRASQPLREHPAYTEANPVH